MKEFLFLSHFSGIMQTLKSHLFCNNLQQQSYIFKEHTKITVAFLHALLFTHIVKYSKIQITLLTGNTFVNCHLTINSICYSAFC